MVNRPIEVISVCESGHQYAGLDRFGRVVDQRWTTSGGTAKDRRKYGYDRDSNRLYAENLVDTSRSELYGYDGLNQIVSFDRGTLNGTKDGISGTPSRSQDWDFDALGNWDSLTTDGGSAQTRGHNKQNEITSIAGATTPTYDANGNMTKDESGRQFKYDAFNRLVEVRDSGSNLLATYRYDALNRRIRVTRGSTTTDLYYSSAWQVLEERVGASTKTSYVWSPVYIDALIARDRDTNADGTLDERLYPVHDVNFNIVGLVDTTGSLVERYAYDAFGGFVILTPAWASRTSSNYEWLYLFQGRPWDEHIGGYDFRHRVLDSVLGRFNRTDPIGLVGGDPNLYRSMSNAPVARVDPYGLWSWRGAAGGGIVGSVVGAPLGPVGMIGGATVGGHLGGQTGSSTAIVSIPANWISDVIGGGITGHPELRNRGTGTAPPLTTGTDQPIYHNGTLIPPTGLGRLVFENGGWRLKGSWNMYFCKSYHGWIRFEDPVTNEVHCVSRYATGYGGSPLSGTTPSGVWWDDPADFERGTWCAVFHCTVQDPEILGGSGYSFGPFGYGSCNTYSTAMWNLNAPWYRQQIPTILAPIGIVSPVETWMWIWEGIVFPFNNGIDRDSGIDSP